MMILKQLAAGVMILGLFVVSLILDEGQDAPKAPPADINKSFEHPDVKNFVDRFESEDREVYAKRQEIVDAIGLTEGMSVADVGAGTGAFTQLFAEKVGPAGKVYAVDIAPEFLEHIAIESKKLGHDHVRTVKGDQKSTHLPKNSLDVVFLCDVYHHLEKPNLTLASIHAALKPGGRLVMVEFDRREGKSKEFILKHVRASKKVFINEIQHAGFAPTELKNAPELQENFFVGFRRLDRRPKPTTPVVPEPKADAKPDSKASSEISN